MGQRGFIRAAIKTVPRVVFIRGTVIIPVPVGEHVNQSVRPAVVIGGIIIITVNLV